VYYEKLITSPEYQIKRMCEFLDIEFLPDLLDTKKYRDENGERWKSNSSYEKKDGFSKSSLGRWETILPEKELGALEYMCKPEMIKEGYTPVTNEEKSFYEFVNYQDRKDKLKKWTFKFKSLLNVEQKEKEIARKMTMKNVV